MGSFIEINDTLQITTQQGFPRILQYSKHLKHAFQTRDFKERVFEFRNKPKLRIYHIPPVRVFLAHNINERWLYWGLIEILEIKLDYIKQTTSGKFRVIKIFSPDQMKAAEEILSTDDKIKFFKNPN